MHITSEIDFTESVIDTRDIVERFEELESTYETFENEAEVKNWADLDEWVKLREIIEEIDANAGDNCDDGVTLINESYFVDYVREMLEDCGEIPRDIPHYVAIDWKQTADNVRVDYTFININGTEFWYR